MIEIIAPENNVAERQYVFDVLLGEFLECDFRARYVELAENSLPSVILNCGANKTIVIEDHFFSTFGTDLEYLSETSLPDQVSFLANPTRPEQELTCIFGTHQVDISDDAIRCGLDIFASAFFMLSRWEEYVVRDRDEFGCFAAESSLAGKHSFLDRPVVDEYVGLLRSFLAHLGVACKREREPSNLILTHDVDSLYRWQSWAQVGAIAAADVIKRKSPALAYGRLREYYGVIRGKRADPYDTYDFLMDVAEAQGQPCRFYFMTGGSTEYDNRYKIGDPRATGLIKRIKSRGHIIGIHPSYDSHLDPERIQREKQRLEDRTGEAVLEGRQHYLRFEVPFTWQHWNDCELQVDSTCGYLSKEGYRCGTGQEFSVFNICTREKLKLKERPLIVMDATLFEMNKYDAREAKERAMHLCNHTHGSSTILWHNSSVATLNFYKDFVQSYYAQLPDN